MVQGLPANKRTSRILIDEVPLPTKGCARLRRTDFDGCAEMYCYDKRFAGFNPREYSEEQRKERRSRDWRCVSARNGVEAERR